MPAIYYDSQSGVPIEGHLWEIRQRSFDQLTVDYGQAWCAWAAGETEEIFGCPVDSAHVTQIAPRDLAVELNGANIGNIVPFADHGFLIVAKRFAAKLLRAHLTGFHIRPIQVVLNGQSEDSVPELAWWHVFGTAGFCRRFRVEEPNQCPRCGYKPMICDGCGQLNDPCAGCDERTVFPLQDGTPESGRGFVFASEPVKRIVEGRDWDGSDFFEVGGTGGGFFATNRAKTALEELQVREFTLRPALLNVDGMTEDFLRRL